jgi:hypothetical protein
MAGVRRRRWRLLHDEQGAAMTEAVILLPALILIWGIIIYIHFGFRDQQRNIATIRSDAWSHAFGGCNTTATSPTQFVDAGDFDGESSGGISGLSDALRFITSTLFMIEEFGARRQVSIARPSSLGGGSKNLDWGLLMLCNEDQRGDDEVPWYEMLFDLDFF